MSHNDPLGCVYSPAPSLVNDQNILPLIFRFTGLMRCGKERGEKEGEIDKTDVIPWSIFLKHIVATLPKQ